jgi:succinoglycan biosynthesis protein ExoV
MQLYFHKAPAGNFGDDLNPWLWETLIPSWRAARDDDHCLFGVGTILTEKQLSRFARPVVIGSGGTYKTVPRPATLARCDFLCVRGPRTRELMGLPGDTPLCDPAMILPEIMAPPAPGLPDLGTIFVPHHLTFGEAFGQRLLDEMEAELGVAVVSPRQDLETVAGAIRRADRVLTESLHGAILAEAFRVPWTPVALSPVFNFFKWEDWGGSIGLRPRFQTGLGAMRAADRSLRALRRRVPGLGRANADWRGGRLLPEAAIRRAVLGTMRRALAAEPQLGGADRLEARIADLRSAIAAFEDRYGDRPAPAAASVTSGSRPPRP